MPRCEPDGQGRIDEGHRSLDEGDAGKAGRDLDNCLLANVEDPREVDPESRLDDVGRVEGRLVALGPGSDGEPKEIWRASLAGSDQARDGVGDDIDPRELEVWHGHRVGDHPVGHDQRSEATFRKCPLGRQREETVRVCRGDRDVGPVGHGDPGVRSKASARERAIGQVEDEVRCGSCRWWRLRRCRDGCGGWRGRDRIGCIAPEPQQKGAEQDRHDRCRGESDEPARGRALSWWRDGCNDLNARAFDAELVGHALGQQSLGLGHDGVHRLGVVADLVFEPHVHSSTPSLLRSFFMARSMWALTVENPTPHISATSVTVQPYP